MIVFGSWGVLPVVLFGSDILDVRGVDFETVGLHPMERCENAASPVAHAFADVNRDGYEDMVVVFGIRDLAMFTPANTEACLHGDTVDGKHFCGHDAVEVRTTR